ncbi:MAG: phosphoribosylformylglycinamidine synthase, purS protein [Bacteroidota bacterium]|jgi:phosphoribosylformylglycinamidine synthase PurS subunit
MKFKAEIDVMPHDALLDPQGKAVTQAMETIGLSEIQGVRIGRHIRLFLEAADEASANQKVEEACKKMLANAIMESYSFSIEEV